MSDTITETVRVPYNRGHKDRSCIVWNLDHSQYGIVIATTECTHGYHGDDLDVVWPTPDDNGVARHTTICAVSCHWSWTGYTVEDCTREHEGAPT
jgi:hypothetical protein